MIENVLRPALPLDELSVLRLHSLIRRLSYIQLLRLPVSIPCRSLPVTPT